MDNNEIRAENFLKQYGFVFNEGKRFEIIRLLEEEFKNYQSGSSEYLRVLCGYLFCIGNTDDVELIKKIKYNVNFDIGCMIDSDWIDCLDSQYLENHTEMVDEFIRYYTNYFDLGL